MLDDTILCWAWPQALQHLLPPPDPERHVTVADCKEWLHKAEAGAQSGKDNIAEFFRQRLRERYIDPVQRPSLYEENGFSIMALSCLLIEIFETYRQGWISSGGKSEAAFCYFFDRNSRFHDFRGYGSQFYKHVRCGILHQGETTGGWTIHLIGPMLDNENLRINADTFQKTLSQVVDDYQHELKKEPLTANVWRRVKVKLNATIKNCER